MPEEQQVDTTGVSPGQGHETAGADEMFQKMYSGEEKTPTTENQGENNTETQPQEKLYAGKYKSAEELEKAHLHLQTKIGQKSELEKQAEQMQQALEKEPRLAMAIRLAAQDPNFQTVLDMWDKGIINTQQLEMYRQNAQKQQQPQAVNPQQIQEMVSQEMEKTQRFLEAQNSMRQQYQELSQSAYGEILIQNNIDFETLGKYALTHQLINDNGIPDMGKAFNHYLIDQNPNVYQQLMNMGKNEAQKNNIQKQNAKLETGSLRQGTTEQNTSPAEQFMNMIKQAGTSNGGVPG